MSMQYKQIILLIYIHDHIYRNKTNIIETHLAVYTLICKYSLLFQKKGGGGKKEEIKINPFGYCFRICKINKIEKITISDEAKLVVYIIMIFIW